MQAVGRMRRWLRCWRNHQRVGAQLHDRMTRMYDAGNYKQAAWTQVMAAEEHRKMREHTHGTMQPAPGWRL